LTSETESFGLAALEAMACGVPVVSTDSGGLPEVNAHGVSGMLSPVGNVEAMAENAWHILRDEETYKRFRAGALAQARIFDLENVLPRYEELYKSLVETEKVR